MDATVVERILREANWELVDGIERGAERMGEPAEREGFPLMLAGLLELSIDITAEQLADIALKREQIGDKMAAMCRAEHDRVVAAGGLTVIGTERHESRRIDNQLRGRAGRQGDAGETQFYLSLEDDLMRMNQLRGRAGRQGDAGETQFYLSLEDDLMRMFGGERMDKISNLMVATEMGDDMPIQHKMISKAVEGAQRKVENINFSMRKNVLEYDDVMNKQRQVIYAERNKILDGKDLSDHIDEVIGDTINRCVTEFCPVDSHDGERDLEGLHKWVVELTGRPDAPAFEDAP